MLSERKAQDLRLKRMLQLGAVVAGTVHTVGGGVRGRIAALLCTLPARVSCHAHVLLQPGRCFS